MEQSNPAVDADLAKARSATGIDEPEEAIQESEPENTEQAKPEPKKEPEPKSAKASEEDEADEDEDGDKEDSEEGQEDNGQSKAQKPSTKNRSPLRAAFAQIGELQTGQKKIAEALTEFATAMKEFRAAGSGEKAEAKAEVKATVKDLIEKAKASGADADWLETFANTITEANREEFKKELEPLKAIVAEAKTKADKLDSKDELAVRTRAEQVAFGQEWNGFLPDLQKTYPNATPELLSEARTLMRQLSTSKEYGGESLDGSENKGKQPMPLDYILFKEHQKFDALLKIKSGRSGETGGKEIETDDNLAADDIDLDPETMTPAKLKAYERKKYAEAKPERVEIIR